MEKAHMSAAGERIGNKKKWASPGLGIKPQISGLRWMV
jgi:hypothetical protein